jgi:osmotically-inducible protein OsmY
LLGSSARGAVRAVIPVEEMTMSNLTLRTDVLDELEYEPSIDAANIGVAVDKGVVTLSGHVASYAEQEAALTAARRVTGVQAIADKIEVRYPSNKKTADDEIAKRAVDILRWDSLIPGSAIQVMVRNGWVTLSGMVNSWYQKKNAEYDIHKLSGVIGVTNKIEIMPVAPTSNLKQKIEDALKRHALIEAKGIEVIVWDGNKVVLEGKVRSWDERKAAEIAAWSAPGVRSVEDKLKIS